MKNIIIAMLLILLALLILHKQVYQGFSAQEWASFYDIEAESDNNQTKDFEATKNDYYLLRWCVENIEKMSNVTECLRQTPDADQLITKKG